MKDQVSHPYNTADEIPFTYILSFRQNILYPVTGHVPEIELSPHSYTFVMSTSSWTSQMLFSHNLKRFNTFLAFLISSAVLFRDPNMQPVF